MNIMIVIVVRHNSVGIIAVFYNKTFIVLTLM